MARATYTPRDVISFIQRASSLISLSFWAGWVVHIGFNMAVQDYYGKDEWLARAADAWVDMSPLWGAAIMGAAYGLYMWAGHKLKKWEAALEVIDLANRSNQQPATVGVPIATAKRWAEMDKLSDKLGVLADWFDKMDDKEVFGANPGSAVQDDIRKAAYILETQGE